MFLKGRQLKYHIDCNWKCFRWKSEACDLSYSKRGYSYLKSFNKRYNLPARPFRYKCVIPVKAFSCRIWQFECYKIQTNNQHEIFLFYPVLLVLSFKYIRKYSPIHLHPSLPTQTHINIHAQRVYIYILTDIRRIIEAPY